MRPQGDAETLGCNAGGCDRRILAILSLICAICAPLCAATRNGDELIARAKSLEGQGTTQSLDAAFDLVKQALATDPNDIEYQLTMSRIRVFAGEQHIHQGSLLLVQRKPTEALGEYERAAKIDPSSAMAQDGIRRAREILEELAAHPDHPYDDLLRSPLTRASKRTETLFQSIKPLPQLDVQLSKPLPKLRVNGRNSADVFSTLGDLAGIHVLFDADYKAQSLGRNQLLDFDGLSLEEALDSVALVTKSYWKAIAANTIFVMNDDLTNRAAYDDQVTKVLYLTNVPSAQEMQNIANTMRAVADIKKLAVHPEQNAIVIRADPARAALAEKLAMDLDKARAEIVIDVLILSVSKDWVRNLGIQLGITPANTAITFAPRSSIGGTTGPSGPTIPLSSLMKLAAGDYAVTLPGAAVDALLQVEGVKLLDRAQLRVLEGQKSSLRIGQRVPYATGSFLPGGFGANLSALVNTQFEYFDIGLNLDITAKLNEPDEVTLHIESDHSSIAGHDSIGGVNEPIISQRKRVADVRVKEGEVNFWDIVISRGSFRTASGIPGLSQIPLIGRFFTDENREETEGQLLHLLIPHIVRAPDITAVDLEGVPSGNDQTVKLSYVNRRPAGPPNQETVDVVPQAGAPANHEVAAHAPAVPHVAVPAIAPAAATPALTLTSSTVATPFGTAIAIELSANAANDVSVVSAAFKFDPTMIVCGSIDPGDLLLQGKEPNVTREIDAQAGTATIDINRGDRAAVSGSGALVTLQCGVKQPGTSPFAVTGLTILDGQRQPVSVSLPSPIRLEAH